LLVANDLGGGGGILFPLASGAIGQICPRITRITLKGNPKPEKKKNFASIRVFRGPLS
jgi:hypothetical protein